MDEDADGFHNVILTLMILAASIFIGCVFASMHVTNNSPTTCTCVR